MQNKINAAITADDRDVILGHINQIRTHLPFLIDLTPEERQTLVKMGDRGRPFVEESLNLVETDDVFMPRSFSKADMRNDSELYTTLLPIWMQVIKLHEAFNDTMLLIGSDLMMAGLEVYRNAKENGAGSNLDNLVPLLGQRFKLKPKKDDDDESGNESPTG